ncbi:GntR family transcriptional regulator [Nocardia yamanashiensis]|uniref:GntR family transcriptional regulator n=1 Tax=Nocardia yamanashiensis TaxID=209247 RepID=UPI001E5D50F0|nr:GntR family transcriptional regulator [Nocardia yamanashiensis]UGT42965.1 GntR family transcriptional regulator [Nocardia yamanashiensis]
MSTTLASRAGGSGGSLRDGVYTALRAELMNGEIKFGQRLTEPKLCARFGISRTPIREALAMLATDGLLRREEYGFSPVRPSIPLIRNLYELRITLELSGIQRAIDNPAVVHDQSVLRAERDRWLRLRADPPPQEPGFVVVDEEFHVALLDSSGNSELTRALTAVNARIRHVRMYDFMVNNRVEVTIAEHLAILDAVLNGELPLAYELLRRHIGESLDVVLERVTSAIVAMTLATEQE